MKEAAYKSLVRPILEYESTVWDLVPKCSRMQLSQLIYLRAKKPNKAKDDGKVTERVTVKPLKRRRKKKKSPSALAHFRERHIRFLKKKVGGKKV